MQCLVRTDTLPHAPWGGTGHPDPLPAALCVGGGGAAPTPRPQPYLLGQAVSQASTVPLVLGVLWWTSLRRLLAHRFVMLIARARALQMLKVPEAVVSLEVPQLLAQVPPGLRWELPVLGSSSVKPVVPEDTLGWHGTRGTTHTPTSAAAWLLWLWGPRMMRARPGTPHTSTAGHHPGGPTPPRAAALILSTASHQRLGLRSARGAAGRWVPSPSPLTAGLQDKPHGDGAATSTPLLHGGAGTPLILPVTRPGLGCVVFLFLL